MSGNSEPMVKAVGLGKIFSDFWGRPKAKAVNDIDFEIRPGEVVGLLGPNGSGKSTTVKMILGLLYPTSGSLQVLGRSPRAVEAKREIGYLPEESYLYKYLTAAETLDFFGSLFNLSKAERKLRIEQLLEMVGMSHAANRRIGEFSKGMVRRIGLAQAMINDPSLLILDEPTSGLDPIGCREVKDLIKLLKKRGKTVIVTSHLLSDVEDVCDRVIILYGGKIRAAGSLDELLKVGGKIQLTGPELEPPVMSKVLDLLRSNLSGEEFVVDHPRLSLDDFFFQVVEQARRESVETSGVSGSGKIADYLTGGDAESVAVLNDLLADNKSVEPVETAAETPIEEKPADLNELMSESTAEKTSDVSEDEAAAKARQESDEKLKNLL